MPTREWHVSEALHSFRRLKSILDELTEEEVLAALKIEHGSLRRQSVIQLLTKRAEQLNLSTFHAKLKEEIHGT